MSQAAYGGPGLVGMKGVEKRYPVELSIGECRRAGAAELISSPPIMLDDITASLDDDRSADLSPAHGG